MTEKRFVFEQETLSKANVYDNENDGEFICCTASIWVEQLVECLNNLHEENKQVKKVLQKYFNRYTQMAVELIPDKYGNVMCHDVTEVIQEIADELEMELEDWE